MLAVCLATYGCKSKKKVQRGPQPAEQREQDTADMQEELEQGLPGSQVERVDEGVKITFDAAILFELNSSALTDKAREHIGDLVAVLERYPESRILIAGHTDATGKADYNQWLSEKRAESVKKYAASLGIPAVRMQTEGYGETRPVADNSTSAGMAKNRRVEVTILRR